MSMLHIDDSCIKSVTPGPQYGCYDVVAEIGDHRVDLSYCGGQDPEPIEPDERRIAMDTALDHLIVVSTQERITIAQILADWREEQGKRPEPIAIHDEELRRAIAAAERIGDDEIDDIVGLAWSRGLLVLKPQDTGAGIRSFRAYMDSETVEEDDEPSQPPPVRMTDPDFLAKARAM